MRNQQHLPENEHHCCSHDKPSQEKGAHEDHGHNHGHVSTFKSYLAPLVSLTLLLMAIVFDYTNVSVFTGYFRVIWYLAAYIPVAYPVIKMALKAIIIGDIFTEFLLMALATIGALALGEYAEAVAVMLFYTLGELFQEAAVNRAKRNISALLDVRPTISQVLRNGVLTAVHPGDVEVGETIQLKVGEKAPLDGVLLSDVSSFNTAALTGESVPRSIKKEETVLAGMLNLTSVVDIKVTQKFEDSALSKILEMVQSATSRKAKPELFIRKFAKIYTPIVFFLAVALVIIPYFFIADYQFQVWLYRALVFLVISCPCALVISIPLGYFGGIGAASANGILFKGSNYLDLLTRLNTVVMDKTGTLTKGTFKVVGSYPEIDEARFKKLLVTLEAQSTHPIAKAIVASFDVERQLPVSEVQEISGLGLSAKMEGKQVIAGNVKLFKQYQITYPTSLEHEIETVVLLAVDGEFAGCVSIADELKEDAKSAITELKAMGINVFMLSGDKSSVTQKLADQLGIREAYGDLLPADKVKQLEKLKNESGRVVAFVGDGINDAPVLALSDVGMAMGAMGSDLAIETADVVIQNDKPSSIVAAIKIAKATKSVVYQNIAFAFIVKAIVLLLGAGGLATMWEAVFADVGVALLAILNAVRIQRMRF